MYVIIDNGHGAETPGKRSPDGVHREWKWCRDMARRICAGLSRHGIGTALLVAEDTDVPLRERTRRANTLAAAHPGAILVSIHNNAAGSGSQWLDARGWSAFVAPQASVDSRRLASLLTAEAVKAGLEGNRATPACGYWTANLAICRDTACPAVLTENLFQDNHDDVTLLSCEHGRRVIANIHVNAILKYFNSAK